MLTGHEYRILPNDRLFPMSLIREWLCVFGLIGSALAAAVGPPGTVPTNSAPVHTAPPKAAPANKLALLFRLFWRSMSD